MTNDTFEEIMDGSENQTEHQPAQNSDDSLSESDSSLEALVNQEETIARHHLQNELGREPTKGEIDEWLSAHTESY